MEIFADLAIYYGNLLWIKSLCKTCFKYSKNEEKAAKDARNISVTTQNRFDIYWKKTCRAQENELNCLSII